MYENTIQLLCVFGRHFWFTFLRYVCITYWNNVTVTFRFRLLLRRNFLRHNCTIYLFKWFHFLMTLELHWIMENVEPCELCIEVTLWNGHILVTLIFKVANFLIILLFLIMVRSHLCWYFSTLNVDIMLQLHFIFIQHKDKLFKTS